MQNTSFQTPFVPPLPEVIQSSKRGERMVFTQTAESTGGAFIEFEHTMQKQSGYSEEHLHVTQEERYEIKQGTAVYVINGVEKTAQAGETVVIPPNTFHVNPWNRDGTGELIIHRRTQPDGGAQLFFVTWLTLVNADLHITPLHFMNLLQISLIGAKIPAKTYVKNTPIFLQKIIIPVLGFIAQLLGYRIRYPELESSHDDE